MTSHDVPTIRQPRQPLGRLTAALAVAGLLATACSDDTAPVEDYPPPPPGPAEGLTETPTQDEPELTHSGRLAPPETAQDAYTYNPELAPAGAELTVEVDRDGGATAVEFSVDGLLPNRGYAVHAHVDPCGQTGEAAGPHFQHNVDPNATPDNPSTDPAYANPDNEIWLDIRTNGEGDGETRTTVPFVFTERAPGSVVVHEAEVTATEPGKAGKAGDRLACLTVPFGTTG
ncbi:superoxide dismutase, Cu-Zn family [Amycolatopsis arida]|uniref:Superoxide dismutase, Cu-Zn family n=1 Tax=Amycolatopsis arida TaxID=587909 RepID=A0A1I5LQ81_9PSEU|nr:superoxide dismutase family protein [Amycolatopsis arida]TDX93802.1 Cu-Zn family superoxide dismutase [Amycolatopsis arida]SFO99478.1 superoxide dismutase, Cu-Zn family [Amycolatopsis arida]